MFEKVKNISDVEAMKKMRREKADTQLFYLKESFNMAKSEGRKALVKNVLIPGGIAAGTFFIVRALIKRQKPKKSTWKSRFQRSGTAKSHNVDWMNLMVKAIPFAIGMGKQLYEEDNLPFIKNPNPKR